MRQATEIQSHASDIRQTTLLIEGVLVTLMFDNDNFKDEATEKELEAIFEKTVGHKKQAGGEEQWLTQKRRFDSWP